VFLEGDERADDGGGDVEEAEKVAPFVIIVEDDAS
jgi:hypothetical protein